MIMNREELEAKALKEFDVWPYPDCNTMVGCLEGGNFLSSWEDGVSLAGMSDCWTRVCTREEFEADKKLGEESRKSLFDEYRKRLLVISPNKDVLETLQKLKKKYLLFVNSSTAEEALNEYLEKYNLDGLFEEVLGYNFSKSKVKKFKHLFEKYDLKAEDCIFVTDTLGDIKEANEVGLKTIAVDFGFHDRAVLEEGRPLKIVSEFKNLLEI
jgi:HAD superfamily hydrolase (TIGR01509 family)